MIGRNHLAAGMMNGLAILMCALPIEGQTVEVGEVAVASVDAEAFRLGALRAVERYRTPAQATLDGYRSVGPDFPGMGVHWLNMSSLIGGKLDPDRPTLLCYIEIDGSPVLVNVAHGMALLGGQHPPTVAGLPPDPWHEHYGTVEEEMTRPGGHAGSGQEEARKTGARVVLFHVWTTPNPAGSFAQHNWALPFLRAGLAVPDEPSEFAARFVGLGTETGLRYQLDVVEILFPEKVREEALSQIHGAAEAAVRWISTLRGREAVDSVVLSQLDESWRALGVRLVGLAPNEQVATRVAQLHGV